MPVKSVKRVLACKCMPVIEFLASGSHSEAVSKGFHFVHCEASRALAEKSLQTSRRKLQTPLNSSSP